MHSSERLPKPEEYPILYWGGDNWYTSTNASVFSNEAIPNRQCWWMQSPPSPEPGTIEEKSKPNSDWVSAPYEINGLSTVKGFGNMIEVAVSEFKAIEVKASLTDNGMLIWSIKQVKP